MPEILITVRDKLPVIVGDIKSIVTDNSDYIVRFVFDEQWENGEKTVYFVRSNGYVYPPVKIENDTVSVPTQRDAGLLTRLLIGVRQGEVKTSRPCVVAIYPSVTDMIEDDAIQPEQSLWEAVLNRLDELEKNGGGNGGIFTETDPTVPEWAKQPNKPTYTAKEVGALPATTKIPAKTSDLQNDSGFITSNDLPEIPESAVQSVNGKTGAVQLVASDVGALPATTKIPAKTSELTNDSGFITRLADDLENYYTKKNSYSRTEIDEKISVIPKFSIEVVSELPTSGISSTTVYLVGGGFGSDLYVEYIYVNGAWETLGAQRVDLTGYAKETWVAEQISALGRVLSADISGAQNDAEHAMSLAEGADQKADDALAEAQDAASDASQARSIAVSAESTANTAQSAARTAQRTADDAVGMFDSIPAWAKEPVKPEYTAAEVGALPATTKIPAKTSDLQNDSGFITGYTETDPTVPAWAKQQTKPTYTATEVGADSVGTADKSVSEHDSSTESHNDIRLLIEGLTTRLNTLADSDDVTLDQMSELVAYIKANKSLIDSITTSKVSVTDIVNNLTTNVSNKPLSAAQGVALKALCDELKSGKLDASALTEAVNAALAQAKESGEFDGDPGTSPTVSVETIAGGHRITITDKNSTKTVDVMDGTNGNPGRGITSIARTSGTGAAGTTDTYTITYSDNTTSTFSVYNGKDGDPYTLTSADKAAIAQEAAGLVKVPNVDSTLKVSGAAADAKAVGDKVNQLSTEIADYETLTLQLHTDGLVYIFKNGVPVGTGVAIVASGGDVIGNVDSVNNIVLTGSLPAGTYTFSYLNNDGTESVIGTHTITEDDTGDTIDVLSAYEINLNKRYSASAGGLTPCNGCIAISIPVTDFIGKAIVLRGFDYRLLYNTTSDGKPQWYIADDSGTAHKVYGGGTYGFWDSTSDDLTVTEQSDGSYKCEFSGIDSLTDYTLWLLLVVKSGGVQITEADLNDKAIEIV